LSVARTFSVFCLTKCGFFVNFHLRPRIRWFVGLLLLKAKRNPQDDSAPKPWMNPPSSLSHHTPTPDQQPRIRPFVRHRCVIPPPTKHSRAVGTHKVPSHSWTSCDHSVGRNHRRTSLILVGCS